MNNSHHFISQTDNVKASPGTSQHSSSSDTLTQSAGGSVDEHGTSTTSFGESVHRMTPSSNHQTELKDNEVVTANEHRPDSPPTEIISTFIVIPVPREFASDQADGPVTSVPRKTTQKSSSKRTEESHSVNDVKREQEEKQIRLPKESMQNPNDEQTITTTTTFIASDEKPFKRVTQHRSVDVPSNEQLIADAIQMRKSEEMAVDAGGIPPAAQRSLTAPLPVQDGKPSVEPKSKTIGEYGSFQ